MQGVSSVQSIGKSVKSIETPWPVHVFILASICAKQLEESPKKHMILRTPRSMVLEMGEATIRISE